MANIVDGKKISDEILSDLRFRINDFRSRPRLAVVLVGDNQASLSYIKVKQKKSKEIGIKADIHNYKVDIREAKLIEEIKKLNADPSVSGTIVQLPLPHNLDREKVLNSVSPEKDVDCLTETNKKLLIEGRPLFIPPAAAAVMEILEHYHVFPSPGDGEGWGRGRNILLVGSGDLIGKPLSAILLNKKVPFELANRHTENLSELALKADVIITGVGKVGLITGDMIKTGAVVIDAGTTGSDEGTVVGDVDFESVAKKASLISPVPGGVGPVTVAMLLKNVVYSAGIKV